MNLYTIVIADKRVEIALKYKKLLSAQAEVVTGADDIIETLEQFEPELVLLSDTVDAMDLCKKIRELKSYRPIIIVLSKSDYLEDKLDMLEAGADDFFSEPIEPKELVQRVSNHLKRRAEDVSNPDTNLPYPKEAHRVLKKLVHSQGKWAVLYIGINNLDAYREAYGIVAGDKIIQALSMVFKIAVGNGDFVAHVSNDSFVFLTSSIKAEKVASYLVYAFEKMTDKFYSKADVDRGYILLKGAEKAEMRVPFASISIGVATNEHRQYNNYQELLNSAFGAYKTAKSKPFSSYIVDRPQIEGETFLPTQKLAIAETDTDLKYLLMTVLKLQGYDTVEFKKGEVADIFIVDDKHLDSIQKIKKLNPNAKIIATSDKREKGFILNSGADLYLPKPYKLTALFNWIERML